MISDIICLYLKVGGEFIGREKNTVELGLDELELG